MNSFCECGCGDRAKSGNRFLQGHSSRNAKRPDLAERNRNRVWTEEARQKISVANTGRKQKPRSPEYGENIRRALKLYYSTHTHHKKGKPHSKEHREKIAAALRGKPLSEERKAKISKARKGQKGAWWTGYRGGYPEEEWHEARERALERDGRVCLIDETHEFVRYKNPDVHHIDGVKLDCSQPNLICLCKRCHAAAHGDLKTSAPAMHRILTDRYGYSYA